MTRLVRAAIEVLDAERRACGEPGGGVVGAEQQRARRGGHELERKVYEHDPAATELALALVAANFQADDPETVLVLDLEQVGANRVAPTPEGVEVRSVRGEAGLRDVAHISALLGRNDIAAETRRLAGLLAAGTVSVQVAYLAGEPVSCGRLHYAPNLRWPNSQGAVRCQHTAIRGCSPRWFGIGWTRRQRPGGAGSSSMRCRRQSRSWPSAGSRP